MQCKQLHPLINKESPHYDTEKTSAIEELEKVLTVTEMIGFCKGNIFKCQYRAEHKGQRESDIKKIETYENYLSLLLRLDNAGYFLDTVAMAFEKSMISFRYR
jgi:aminopeptidase C